MAFHPTAQPSAALDTVYRKNDGSNGPFGITNIEVDSVTAFTVSQADSTNFFVVDTSTSPPEASIYDVNGTNRMYMYHDDSNNHGYVRTSVGNIRLRPAQVGAVRRVVIGDVPGVGNPEINVYSGFGGRATNSMGRDNVQFFRFEYKDDTLETFWAVYHTAGNQTSFTNTIYVNSDHDHANQSSPTWYWQGPVDPDVDNTQWGSATFDGTDLFFGLGSGSFRFDGNMIIGNGDAGTDYTLTFDGETNDGVVTWMEDEDYFDFDKPVQVESRDVLRYNLAMS